MAPASSFCLPIYLSIYPSSIYLPTFLSTEDCLSYPKRLSRLQALADLTTQRNSRSSFMNRYQLLPPSTMEHLSPNDRIHICPCGPYLSGMCFFHLFENMSISLAHIFLSLSLRVVSDIWTSVTRSACSCCFLWNVIWPSHAKPSIILGLISFIMIFLPTNVHLKNILLDREDPKKCK